MDRARGNRGNHTGREQWIPVTPQRGSSIGRGVIQVYAPEIRRGGSDRASLRGSVQPNATAPNKPLPQREAINVNEDIAPKVLTSMFKQCTTFEKLNNLYNGQKDKPYFNSIRAYTCFSQAVSLFTQFERYENTNSQEQLAILIDKLISYNEELKIETLANIANDALKLLNFAQNNTFLGAESIKKLALNTLRHVFQAVIARKNLQNLKLQVLSYMANDAVKLLNYAKQKNSEGTEFVELALSTLCCIFQAFNTKNDLQRFRPQVLSDLANDAVIFLDYIQTHRRFSGAESVVWNAFRTISQEMNVRVLILEG